MTPREMISGEWYIIKFKGSKSLIKFDRVQNEHIYDKERYVHLPSGCISRSKIPVCTIDGVEDIWTASRLDVEKWFPGEFRTKERRSYEIY